MIVSAAMMLNWLAEKHDTPALAKASAAIEQALERGFKKRNRAAYGFGR
jgi:isocitrate/isopropylmalate dehydrogenase